MTTPEDKRNIAAFFDLDRTLLEVNSAALWVEYEHREGRISRLQLAQAAVWLIGYKFGVIDMESALKRAVGTLKGVKEQEVADRTFAWYDAHIVPTILQKGRETIEMHRSQGHRLVLLTSSSPYISSRIAEDLHLDHYLCNRFEVIDGIFTGDPILPMCYGPGKVTLARAWSDQEGVDLKQSYFYTDSLTDLPMLEAVGHPRVINPDPRLRRLARKRGWPIEDWAVGRPLWKRRTDPAPEGR